MGQGGGISRGGTLLATAGTCLCQGLSVYEQLIAGARYLDIRPTITEDGWFSGHYSLIRSPVWGGCAEDVAGHEWVGD